MTPPNLLFFKDKLSSLRIPIRVKLSIAITFIIWLTTLILSFVILTRQKDQLYLQTFRTGKVTLNYLANDARIPLLNDDILRLNSIIKEVVTTEGFRYGIIIDRQRVIKAHTDHTKIGTSLPRLHQGQVVKKEQTILSFSYFLPSGENILDLSKPIVFKNIELGIVHVGISIDFIKNLIRQESIFIIILSLLIVLLGISIAILLGISFSRPISKLVFATQEIGKGNFKYKIDMNRKDELGDLATAFNYMSDELFKKMLIQQSFGRYVNPKVLDMILSHPDELWLNGIRSEVTILFTDIRGFTAYSETTHPEEVVKALNEYFGLTTQYILDYGGYIDKFIGDAVLGVFGVPIQTPDHAEKAIRAAFALQNELQRLAKHHPNPFFSRIGMSINTGEVVSGNLGSQVKMEYTVIGDTVNVASRLNGLAGPGEIIISKSLYLLMGSKVSVKPLPLTYVKGKSEPIEAFQLLDILEQTSSETKGVS